MLPSLRVVLHRDHRVPPTNRRYPRQSSTAATEPLKESETRCSARASLPAVERPPPALALRHLNSFGQPPDHSGIYRAPRQPAMAPAFSSAVRRPTPAEHE